MRQAWPTSTDSSVCGSLASLKFKGAAAETDLLDGNRGTAVWPSTKVHETQTSPPLNVHLAARYICLWTDHCEFDAARLAVHAEKLLKSPYPARGL